MDALIANITWNPYGWRNQYTNPKAGHKYARAHPGHESLNFKFNKERIDTADKVYGFIQWTNPPKVFTNGGVILFYSKNLDTNEYEVVGVYGRAEILKTPLKKKWDGFENDEYYLNISALKNSSLLFPVPLKAKKYLSDMRSQTGYKYIGSELAGKIIKDELLELSNSSGTKEEFRILGIIYKSLTGDDYLGIIKNSNEKEQDELSVIVNDEDRKQIIKELREITPLSPEIITLRGKQYRRDNKTIASLKHLRGYKCQICGTSILKEDGSSYVEAAHIQEKSHGGPETPKNILILCPNHHKEFDLGERKVVEHTDSLLKFVLNGVSREIDLSLK